ncbi:MAG: hypothetical protein LUP94_03775, partial [Candidatus Methanomethylicus sp.]|nr:hypothetical protein [Candidatus Methanomethylicus sp.]
DAAGLNPGSQNYFDDLIQIHNAGAEEYNITLSSDNPNVKFYTQTGQWFTKPGLFTSLTINNLAPGNNLVLGLYVDARSYNNGDTITGTITLSAENLFYGSP